MSWDTESSASPSSSSSASSDSNSLYEILCELIRRESRPSESEWRLFRTVCSSRNRQEECHWIFDYFRQILLPLTFSSHPCHTKLWTDIKLVGLSKSRDAQPGGSNSFFQTQQFGDDAAVLGGNYLIISDGITRDSNSDFFASQVVECLNVGIRRINLQRDLGEELVALVQAVEALVAEVKLPAAATLTLAYLSKDDYLYVASLGDSQLAVIRSGRLIYSTPVQRSGNIPGQLNCRIPQASDDMTFERLRVRSGDYVILASDGLWDNLFASEVAEVVGDGARQTASRLLNMAMERKDGSRRYYRENQRTGKRQYVGRRRDDITIIVARV